MWSHEQIHERAFDAYRKALANGSGQRIAHAAMIGTAIAMAIDNASIVAGRVGADVAQDEIIALRERCTLAPRPPWHRRLFNLRGA